MRVERILWALLVALGCSGKSATTGASLTKDGITWTFDRPVVSGQFVGGDYWVVGPVTVTSISPAPTRADPFENGSVVNLPTHNGKSAFDSRLNDGTDESWWFDESLRTYAPALLHPGDALVSSISLAVPHSLPEVMRQGDSNASPVETVSVLTVLAAPAPPGAFRPSYCDRGQALHSASGLRIDLLPALAPPRPTSTPPLSQFASLFRRPWIDTNAFLFDVPAAYMPSYGQHVAFAVSYASLLLALDFPSADKTSLAQGLVQYGIDLYGCVKAGYGWPAFGGHRSGRKLPILLAGLLLDDDAMKNVATSYPNQFGEDMQTVRLTDLNGIPGDPPGTTYPAAWQGAAVIYGGHYGVDVLTGMPVSTDRLYGPYEQWQPRSWPTTSDGEQLGEAYRRCCTSVSWVGEALSARLLGLTDLWNHPAFFEYVDRWMAEPDAQAVADIKAQTGVDYSADWERQGQTRYWLEGEYPQATFIDDMWSAYRGSN